MEGLIIKISLHRSDEEEEVIHLFDFLIRFSCKKWLVLIFNC